MKCWSIILLVLINVVPSEAQRVEYELTGFQFTIYVDTLTRVEQKPYRQHKQVEEVIRIKWQDTTKYCTENDPRYKSPGSPLLINGVVFAENSLDYAYDALTGERLYYGTEEANSRFASFEHNIIDLYGAKIDITTGQKVNINANRGSKHPFFVQSDTWVGGRYDRNSKMGYLERLRINTGDKLWSIPNSPGYDNSRVALYNDILYIGNREGLYAINYGTGEVLWKLNTYVERVLLSGSTIYVGTLEDGMLAMDVTSASQPSILYSFTSKDVSSFRDFALEGDTLFMQGGDLLAFNVSTKRPIWKANASYIAPWYQLSIHGDYIIGYGSEAIEFCDVFDKHTGEIITTLYDENGTYAFAKGNYQDMIFASYGCGGVIVGFEIVDERMKE